MVFSSGKFFNDFIFGNYFIALCATGMVFTTFLMTGTTIHVTPFTILITLATFLLYNFHKLSFNLDYSGGKKLIASSKRLSFKSSEKISFVVAGILLMVSLPFQKTHVLPYLLPLVILSFLYSVPLIKWRNKKIRLLEVFLIKTFILAFVWALATTIIPLLEENIEITSTFITQQVLSRMLFIFALCIPFEMRDLLKDKENNVKTLPVIFGMTVTKVTGFVVILIEIILHHLMKEIPFASIISLDISSLIALYWIFRQEKNKNPYYYKFLVDGTMLLRFGFMFSSMYFI